MTGGRAGAALPPSAGKPARTHGLICVVTDRRLMGHRMMALIAEVARAGVDVIQIRERDLEGAALLSLVREAVSAAAGSGARVLVNDRVDVALAAEADGVHLRSDSIPAGRVRTIAPDGFIIGRSVHSPAEAAAATVEVETNFLMFGTVFPSASKPEGHPVAGLAALESTVRTTRLPVLAIGGVTVDRVRAIAATGAAGVAGIGLFAGTDRPGDVVLALRNTFDTRS